MVFSRESCLMEKNEKFGGIKPTTIFENSASLSGDIYEGTVFTFTNSVQAAEAPRLRSSSVSPYPAAQREVADTRVLAAPDLPVTEMTSVPQMRETLMFPEIWTPCQQPSLPMSDKTQKETKKNADGERTENHDRRNMEATCTAPTGCNIFPLQQRLRRIKTREERSDVIVGEEHSFEEGCIKPMESDTGYLHGQGELENAGLIIKAGRAEARKHEEEESARLPEWKVGQAFEEGDVRQDHDVQEKKPICGTKRMPDTYSNAYKSKGWPREAFGGTDSENILKMMQFMDKNGSEDVNFRIGALKKPKVCQSKDVVRERFLHNSTSVPPLSTFQMSKDSVTDPHNEGENILDEGVASVEEGRQSKEQLEKEPKDQVSRNQRSFAKLETEMECSDSPLACSFISFKTGESSLLDSKGRKVVDGGNMQLLQEEDRTCLGQAYAADVRLGRDATYESAFPGFDQVAKNVNEPSNGRQETFWDAREQLDGSPQQSQSQEGVKDDTDPDPTNMGRERNSRNSSQADASSLVECDGTQIWPGWETFPSLKEQDPLAWQQLSLQSGSKTSLTKVEDSFLSAAGPCGKALTEVPGTPTEFQAGGATQAVENSYNKEALKVTENGVLDLERICNERPSLECGLPQITGHVDNPWGISLGGKNIQSLKSTEDLFCQHVSFHMNRSPNLPGNLTYSEECSTLECAPVGDLQSLQVVGDDSAEVVHYLQDRGLHATLRERVCGAHEPMSPEAHDTRIAQLSCHISEMTLQGLDLSERLMGQATAAEDHSDGVKEARWSERDTLSTKALEETQNQGYLFTGHPKTGEGNNFDQHIPSHHNAHENQTSDFKYFGGKPAIEAAELASGEQEGAGIATEVANEDRSYEETPPSRRRKMPIVLRVKNGLKNGWLKQNWKRGAAKPKNQPDEKEILPLEGQIFEMGRRQNDLSSKAGPLVPSSDPVLTSCINGDDRASLSEILSKQKMDLKAITDFHSGGTDQAFQRVSDVSLAIDKAKTHQERLSSKDRPSEASLQQTGLGISADFPQSTYTLWGCQNGGGLPFGDFSQLKVDTATEQDQPTNISVNSQEGLPAFDSSPHQKKSWKSEDLTLQQCDDQQMGIYQGGSAASYCESAPSHDREDSVFTYHQDSRILESLNFLASQCAAQSKVLGFTHQPTPEHESSLLGLTDYPPRQSSPGDADKQEDHSFHSNWDTHCSPLELPVVHGTPTGSAKEGLNLNSASTQLQSSGFGDNGLTVQLENQLHTTVSNSSPPQNLPITDFPTDLVPQKERDVTFQSSEPPLTEAQHGECTRQTPGKAQPHRYKPIGWEAPFFGDLQALPDSQGVQKVDGSSSFQKYSTASSWDSSEAGGLNDTLPTVRESNAGSMFRNSGLEDNFWDGFKSGQHGWPDSPLQGTPKEEEVFLEKFSGTRIDLHPHPPAYASTDNLSHHSRANSMEQHNFSASASKPCNNKRENALIGGDHSSSWAYPQKLETTRSTLKTKKSAGFCPQLLKPATNEPYAFSYFKLPVSSAEPPVDNASSGSHHQLWHHQPCVGSAPPTSSADVSWGESNAAGSHQHWHHQPGVDCPNGYVHNKTAECQVFQGVSPSIDSHPAAFHLQQRTPYSAGVSRPSSGHSPRPYDPFAFHTTRHANTHCGDHRLNVPHQHCGWEHKGCALPAYTTQPPSIEPVMFPQTQPIPTFVFKPHYHDPSCGWQDQLSHSWHDYKGPHPSCSPPYPWPYAYPPPPPPAPGPLQSEHCSAKCMSPLGQEVAPSVASHGSSDSKQQKLLWLSEEESELIRQLRQHGVKGSVRDSDASLSDQPPSRGTIQEDAGFAMTGRSKSTTSSLCSNMSSTETSPRLRGEGRTQNLSLTSTFPGGQTNVLEGRHNAAACIQRRWRQYACEQGGNHDLPLKKHYLMPSNTFMSEIPLWQRQLKHSQLRRVTTTLQAIRRGHMVRRWYKTLKKAAIVIQRAWRAFLRRKLEKKQHPQKNQLPKNLKDFYVIVKRRYTTRGLTPPSYEKFVRSLGKIQAATRGARVRCRLKSRRLQTIIMEIKEIRALLEQMSHEPVRESSPYLIPQLCRQLQQKITQLHTALTGPETEARYVLRRGPASPLVMCTSRSTVAKTVAMVNHLSGDNLPIKFSAVNIHPPPQMATSLKKLSERSAAGFRNEAHNPVGDVGKLHWYFSPSHHRADPVHETAKSSQGGQVLRSKLSHADNSGGHSSGSTNNEATPLEQGYHEHMGPTRGDARTANAGTSKVMQENGLQTSSLLPSKPIEEQPLDRGRALLSEAEQTDFYEHPDVPKRPFLRRKSVIMPAQKLDWSKVKPVVSSRLEPELQTKLSMSKPKSSNPPVSKPSKTNYDNVKSRLFSYETASSPNSSREGSRGYASDVEIRRTLTRDRGSLEANNFSPPCNRHMNRSPDLDMDPSYRMKFLSAEAEFTSTSDAPGGDIRFGRNRGMRLTSDTQRKPWVRYLQKNRVVVEEKVGALDLGRLPKIKVHCKAKEKVGDVFQLPHDLEDEVSLWGPSRQCADRVKKKGSHSYRYANSKDMQQGYAAHLAARNEEAGVRPRDAPQQETRKVMHNNPPTEIPVASKELEKLFSEVMSRKRGNNLTLKGLFGSRGQEGSIIPRLHPASHIFQASFTEKNVLFRVLKEEGRASQCRHDCLTFVSSQADSCELDDCKGKPP